MAGVLLLAKLGWRNLWRNPQRTLLTALALGMGLALLLICLGLMDGIHEQGIATGVRFRTGHVVVQARGYQDTPAQGLLLPGGMVSIVEAFLHTEAMTHSLQGVSPRLVASGLLSSATNSSGVGMLGVIPAAEKTVSLIPQRMVEGSYLRDDAPSSEVVIGIELARKLKAKVGSKVVLMAQSMQQPSSAGADRTGGEIHTALLRVSGIFSTGLQAVDAYMVHVPLRRTQEFLGTPDQVSQIAIVLEREDSSLPVATRLREQLAGALVEVLTWQESMTDMARIFWLDDTANYVINGILLMIVGLGVLNTILMTVLERRYEFGVCTALGLGPRQLVGMIFCESLALTVISLALGLALGMIVHYYFATSGLALDWLSETNMPIGLLFAPVVYSYLSLSRIVWSLSIVFVMTMILSLYPAFKAARTELPDALRMF